MAVETVPRSRQKSGCWPCSSWITRKNGGGAGGAPLRRPKMRVVRVWRRAHDATRRSSERAGLGSRHPQKHDRPPPCRACAACADRRHVRLRTHCHRVVVAFNGYTVGRQPLAIAYRREEIHSAQILRVSTRASENACASGGRCRYRDRTTRPCVPAYTRAA